MAILKIVKSKQAITRPVALRTVILRTLMSKNTLSISARITCLLVIMFLFLVASPYVFAGTISLSLGSYDSEIYNQESINIPVVVTCSNISGNVDVTLSPKTGLSCSTCTLSQSFTGATNEQATLTFTLTASQAGTYNPPFISISGSSGSTTATPISSGSQVSVVERPTWVLDFSASDETVDAGDEVTLTLSISPSGSFSGVAADLTLPSGWSLVSGTDPRSIGTLTGEASYQWIVKAGSSSGTVRVGVSASDPSESASENTESISMSVSSAGDDLGDDGDDGGSGGGGGGGGISTISESFSYSFDTLNVGLTSITVNKQSIPFTSLDLSLIQNAQKGYIIIKTLTSNPLSAQLGSGASGAYKYLSVDLSNLSQESISAVKIYFKVEKSWLLANNIAAENIALYRYTDKWTELSTVKTNEDANYTYYSAVSPGFSYFAIAQKSVVSTAQPAPQEQQSQDSSKDASVGTSPDGSLEGDGSASDAVSESDSESKSSKSSTSKWAGLIVVIVLLAVAIGIVFYARKIAIKKNQKP